MEAEEICSEETYTVEEFKQHLRDTMGDYVTIWGEDPVPETETSVHVEWHKDKSVDVFNHLLKHGWIVNASDWALWFEQVGEE